MSISKAGKNQWMGASGERKGPFELPRRVAKQIKQCAEASAPTEDVQHLWINLAADDGQAPRPLRAEEWKNVVDEAASLGVRSMVVCTPANGGISSDLWDVCQWAQATYEMSVALYTSGPFDEALQKEVLKLDPARTSLLVAERQFQEAQPLIEAGIKVYTADAAREEHPLPCAGSRNMVYVGASGKLYPCGLAHGSDAYLLGDVMEDPLAPIRHNESLPWTVKEACNLNGCDACPNILRKRGHGV